MCWSENSQVFSTIDRNSSMLATKHVRMRAMIVYAIARHTLQNYVWRKFCFQIFLTIAPGKKKKHTNDRYSNESIRLECLYIHSIVPLCGEFIARRKSGYVTIVRHGKTTMESCRGMRTGLDYSVPSLGRRIFVAWSSLFPPLSVTFDVPYNFQGNPRYI